MMLYIKGDFSFVYLLRYQKTGMHLNDAYRTLIKGNLLPLMIHRANEELTHA
jgi:hypothetical protein